jgi:hypothetical protein
VGEGIEKKEDDFAAEGKLLCCEWELLNERNGHSILSLFACLFVLFCSDLFLWLSNWFNPKVAKVSHSSFPHVVVSTSYFVRDLTICIALLFA